MLKVSVIILAVMLAYGGIYSLMNLIAPQVIMKSSFKAMTGESLDSIEDAGYLKALSGGHRYMGVYALVTVILGFFILIAAFQKARKWAWWSMLVGGGIMWLWGLINTIVIGDAVNLVGHIVGTLLFLVGLLLPIRDFFAKAAKEAQ